MGKQLKKKLIVTANLDNLKEADFCSKANSIINAHLHNPTYVPGLTPPATDMETESQAIEDMILHRSRLEAELKATNVSIREQVRKIKNVIVSEWAPQVQNAVGNDESKVKGLGYGIKGKYNGKSLPTYNMTNSYPMILRVEFRSTERQMIFVRNNNLKGRKLPHDAKRLDLYMAFGENAPLDYREMIYLGEVTGGKFFNEFKPEDVGKWVWYVAVYIGRKRGTIPVASIAKRFLVV
jgi:hypothetical protein